VGAVVDEGEGAGEACGAEEVAAALEVLCVGGEGGGKGALGVGGDGVGRDGGKVVVLVGAGPVAEVEAEFDVGVRAGEEVEELGGGGEEGHPVFDDDLYAPVGGVMGEGEKMLGGCGEGGFGGGLFSGDEADVAGAEGGCGVDPRGDPVAVAGGVEGVGEVAVVDEERVEGDVRGGECGAEVGEIGGGTGGKVEVAELEVGEVT